MENNFQDIDLVYLWVDGNDPVWRNKYNTFIGKPQEESAVNCDGRYANNDELKYSLRSIEKYAPWIRRIFIITDNQTPHWLNTENPKIRIVDHKEIMPPECLPCFNSTLLEKYLHKIPGLAEHFLFANDDTFINKPVTPQIFFTEEGFPIVRLGRKPFRKLRWFWREKIRKKPLKNYSASIARASKLIYNKYGIYYTGIPHHNIDAYLKSDCQRVAEDVLRKEFLSNKTNKVRSDNDVQRIVYSYIALAEKRARLHYVNRKESMIVRIYRYKDYERLRRNGPTFFCMNDSEYVKDIHRKILKDVLESLFPDKSSFEK